MTFGPTNDTGPVAEVPATINVACFECHETHVGEYSHEGRYGEGPIYAVVCTRDHLTDYYTREAAL